MEDEAKKLENRIAELEERVASLERRILTLELKQSEKDHGWPKKWWDQDHPKWPYQPIYTDHT